MNLPPYDTFPILETARLILKEIKDEEMVQVLDITYYDGVKAQSEEHAIKINQQIRADYDNGVGIQWGLFDKETDALMGNCGYARGFEKGDELGCVLLEKYRGKGLMFEALSMVIKYSKEKLMIDSIYALTSDDNIKAKALLERLGLVRDKDAEECQYWLCPAIR